MVRFRPDGVLEKAGLRVGDEILAFDAVALTSDTFGPAMRRLRGGQTLKVRWKRGDATR